jgi:hypothetical protein
MPTPLLPDAERLRRKNLVEDYLQDGYAPLGQRGGKGAACNAAHLFDGVNYHRWVASEVRERDAGRPSFIPDWSLYKGATASTSAKAATVRKPSNDNLPSPKESADLRAKLMADEVTSLVTRSNYPVINPEAIIVDSHLSRRFNAKTGEYRDVESTPRTWLSETLMVEPVKDARNRRFIFTAAQNDAPVHEAFWANLQHYAEYLEAELIVGPFTYETQWWSENNPMSRSYDEALTDHLCFGQMEIGDSFIFAGEMNTLPTASQPISDLTTYSRNRWAVFPHAKRQLKSVPSTDPEVQAHQVMTTGSVTKPKVIPRKAGVKSLFHQVLGAVVVEFDEDGRVFARQITAKDDGSFYDLHWHLSGSGLMTGPHRVKAITAADIHTRKLDPTNAAATFGFTMNDDEARYRGSMLDVLRPHHLMLHDVFDHETRNHHNQNDPGHAYEMHIRERDSVLSEIMQVGTFLERLQVAAPGTEIVVVEGNHDTALDRWVREGRYRYDAPNIRIGLKLEEMMLTHRSALARALDSQRKPPRFSLLQSAMHHYGVDLSGVTWAYAGYSRLIDGIEVGHHGHLGVNGAKGGIAGFAKTGRKMSVAHVHSPEINEGVYAAGAMNLQHGYNRGPSSWAVSHIVQYADGNRTLITLQQGRWRPGKPRVAVPAAA